MNRIIIILFLATVSIVTHGQILDENYYETAIGCFYKGEYAKAMKFFSFLESNPELKKELKAYDANKWKAMCMDALNAQYNKGYNLVAQNEYAKALVFFDSFCKIATFFSKDEILSSEVIEKKVDNGDSKSTEKISVLATYLSKAYNYKGVCISYIPYSSYKSEKGKDEDQKECYIKAITFNEKNPMPYSNLAMGIRQGLFKNPTEFGVRELYEKAFSLGDKTDRVADSIAVEYEREGNIAKTAEWSSWLATRGSNYGKMKFAQLYVFQHDKLQFSTPASTILKYLKEAAEDKDKITSSGAKLCLGYVYLSGECGKEAVEYNEYEGKKLLREAANAGNQDARKLLNNL